MEDPTQALPFVGPAANGSGEAPPVHEPPPVVPAPQPMQEFAALLEDARGDIGGLISRTDQLEATVRRVDRQVLMTIGILAVVLWGVRQLAGQIEGIDGGV